MAKLGYPKEGTDVSETQMGKMKTAGVWDLALTKEIVVPKAGSAGASAFATAAMAAATTQWMPGSRASPY